MKILYIAHERAAAAMAAGALQGIAPDVTLTWAQTPASAFQWLEGNPDVSAVMVHVQTQNCAPFVERLRGLGLGMPVIIVAGTPNLEQALAAINAGADGYAVAGASLQSELPRVVVTAIDRELGRRALLAQRLAELRAARERAEQQLARAEEGRQQAEQQLARAEEGRQQAEHQLARAEEGRQQTEQQLARAEEGRQQAEHQLARAEEGRQQTEQQLARAEEGRQQAEQQLARVEEARQQTEQRSASELATASARLAEVQAQHTSSLAREARICTALQQRLFDLETALRNADERRASEAAGFADQLAKRHAEFTSSLAEARDALTAQLAAANAALEEAQQARKADAAAAADQLRRREEEIGAALAEAAAVRSSLEQKLEEAESAHEDARQHAELDLAAANERQAALEDLLAQEADRRASLDNQLALAEAGRQEADQRHAAELAKAAERLGDLQARYDATLAEHAAARGALEQQVAEAAAALERAREEHATEAAAAAGELARREAELGAELTAAGSDLAALRAQYDAAITEHAAARAALEQQAVEAAAAYQQSAERAAAAAAAAAAREAELVNRIATETGVRVAKEGELETARAEAVRSRRRSLHVAAAYRRRGREQKATLEAQLAVERADAQRELHAKSEEIGKAQQEHETLRQLLGTTQDQLQQLHGTIDEERHAHERTRLTSETELRRVSGEYGQLRQSFDALQTAFQILEQVAGEHAVERGRLEGVVAERDSQLSAQAERHRAAEQAAQDAFTQLQDTLRKATESSGSEIGRLKQEVDALRRELGATRSHAASLRAVAERVPDLEDRLATSDQERRRNFERAPYALCRCTPGGVITDANHAFVALLGRRRVDELRNTEFSAAVSDAAGDLAWLFERTQTARKPEPFETGWQTKDGRHLIVRIHALAASTGSVEIVVEDVTALRSLEERLRQAQRMEAVGRLAAEVAGTCDALLRDVGRDVREWVSAIDDSDDAQRRRGERLLAEVTRGAAILRQLGVYGASEERALEPVSVQRVLKELSPVLKRVVGDGIELVSSKSSGSFDVDVEAERLERVLVNVAGYARERMPGGGQIRIDLATTTVGRRFLDRYPNVRPGPHVVITVTELPRARASAERVVSSSDKPGIDVSALVDLVAACGGHVWIEAQPAGNMVVKIHLPKPAEVETGDAQRGGRLARLFRLGSGAGSAAR